MAVAIIAGHNGIVNPDYIRAGQVIEIPKVSTDDSSVVESESANAPEGYEAYVVVEGDTLWDIAESKLRDPLRWIAIFDPDRTNFTEEEARKLQPGSVIYLPKNLMEGSGAENTDDVVVAPIPLEPSPPDSSGSPTVPPTTSQETPIEQPGEPTNPPNLPFASNLGYTVESERVAEGRNINAGRIRGVIIADQMSGKISIESKSDSEGNEDESSLLSPGGLTQNLELSNFAKNVGYYWEAEIIKGLAKWDPQKGFSFNLGGKEVSVWVSNFNAEAFNFKTGTPTTRASFKVEGNLDELIDNALQAQGVEKQLNLPKLEAELEYTAEIAWQAELPRPVPVPVRVPAEVRVPVEAAPNRLPVRPVPPPDPFPVPTPDPSPVPPPFPVPSPSPSPSPWYSKIDAEKVGVAATLVGGVIVAGAVIASAPVWVPTVGVAAIAAGAMTLGGSVFGSDDDDLVA